MGSYGGLTCSATFCNAGMTIPWESLGLRRFLILDGDVWACCEEGEPSGRTDCAGSPRVSYGVSADEIIDLELLARVLFPTLSDHSLDGLCARFSIPRAAVNRLVELFAALINEGLTMSPELLSLLGQLLPGETGRLLLRLAPLAREERPAPSPQRSSEPHLRVSVEEALSRTGAVADGVTWFEERPGQVEMARLVEQTFSEGGTLVVEAGPGTGKTFAYLVPALIYIRDHPGTRVVVSTRTKQLQEQVYDKDIPFLTERLTPNIKTALLKGRENYLCLRQWERVFPEVTEGLDRDLLIPLAYLASWLFRTETGDIEENHAFLSDARGRDLWPRLADSPHRCPGAACPFYADCFSVAARRRAREADLVVVNHSLLFADVKADGGILGNYDYLVVDEAHALEVTARDAFTSGLTPSTLERFLWELHHVRGRKNGGWLANLPLSPDDSRVSSLYDIIGALRAVNLHLFSRLEDELPVELRGLLPSIDSFVRQVDRVLNLLAQLQKGIEIVGDALEDEAMKREAERLSGGVEAISALYQILFSPPQDGYVHWYERRKAGDVALYSTPLAIDEVLKESLYPRVKGIVLTSATLSSGGKFSYLASSLGLDATDGDVRYAVVESPFSYEKKMRIYIPRFLPRANGDEETYVASISKLIEEIFRLGRKVLVLFTSHRMLRAVRSRARGTVIAQGIDGPRGKLVERFKGLTGGAVLLGTDSFWEGVDFPGRNLEILVITRLPFPVPTDPVFAALSARSAAAGNDPFYDLAVPMAVIKLRQGVGRLIRTQSDRGVVIITDRRILEKGYGRMFLAALPVGYEEPPTLAQLVNEIDDWLSQQGTNQGC